MAKVDSDEKKIFTPRHFPTQPRKLKLIFNGQVQTKNTTRIKPETKPKQPRSTLLFEVQKTKKISPMKNQETSSSPRRLIIVRNPKHPNFNEEPSDLQEFLQFKPLNQVPVITNGRSSIYVVRRTIKLQRDKLDAPDHL